MIVGRMVKSRKGHGSVRVGTKIYSAGGWSGQGLLDSIEVFDTETRESSLIDFTLSQPRWWTTAGKFIGNNGNIWVAFIGGSIDDFVDAAEDATNATDVFDTGVKAKEDTAAVQPVEKLPTTWGEVKVGK